MRPSIGDPARRARGVVGLGGRAQDRRLRLERIDLVERPQNREHDVAVVHRIGDRLRKGLAKRFEQFVIVHVSEPRSSGQPPLANLIERHGGDDDHADDDVLHADWAA